MVETLTPLTLRVSLCLTVSPVSSQTGQTALSIAQRLGYISVVETLKVVTETVITTTTTTVTEEKYKVLAPETMHETFLSDSEDEGGQSSAHEEEGMTGGGEGRPCTRPSSATPRTREVSQHARRPHAPVLTEGRGRGGGGQSSCPHGHRTVKGGGEMTRVENGTGRTWEVEGMEGGD